MGKNLTLIINHKLSSTDFSKLPERLDMMTNSINNLLSELEMPAGEESKQIWSWQNLKPNRLFVSDLVKKTEVSLESPNGLFIDVGVKSLNLFTWIRWKEFIFNFHIQNKVRELAFVMSKFFETEKIIYVSDSGSKIGEKASDFVYEGLDVETIELHLKKVSESSSFTQIEDDFITKDIYFVDNF
jgi:hypothetical protein